MEARFVRLRRGRALIGRDACETGQGFTRETKGKALIMLEIKDLLTFWTVRGGMGFSWGGTDVRPAEIRPAAARGWTLRLGSGWYFMAPSTSALSRT